MIVYIARDIPAFVMYCVNGGESGSSLLIKYTDSMIFIASEASLLGTSTFLISKKVSFIVRSSFIAREARF